MKILILRSERAPDAPEQDEYSQEFDTVYADRVIGNLVGDRSFCTACGPDCVGCRAPYGRKFLDRMAGVIVFPAVMPYVLERPEEHVPADVPEHDVLIAIHVHEQVLVECLKRCKAWGTRAAIVPQEAPGWISGSAKREAEDLCKPQGIEIAFPKPFCSLKPPAGTLLAEFREFFHIGYPDVELSVEDNRIMDARVHVSAPCGATYYIARWLKGKTLDDDLKYEIVSKRLHSYPCTSSMEWDDEIDDTVLHVAGQAHYRILAPIGKDVDEEPETIVSPLGKTLQKPVPIAENVRNVENAKQAVLAELAKQDAVPLAALRRIKRIDPAALNAGLLILRQEGRITLRGPVVRRVQQTDG